MEETKTIGTGLLPTPHDPNDYQFAGVFGLPQLSELPSEYKTSEPLSIKNQGGSDLCTSFALCSVSESQENTILAPEFQFAQTKKLSGDWQSWGADLRNSCKSVVKVGSLPEDRLPQEYKLLPDSSNRNFISNWENWPKGIELYATKHRKQSYFSVSGPYSTWNNLRATLWQTRNEERSIFTGITWQAQWTGTDGYIKEDSGQPSFGHAIKVYGWKDDYLIAQLSNGTSIGDRGIFYFHKEVVNRQFTFGAFSFSDLPREEAEWYIRHDTQYRNNWLRRLIIRLWA